MGGAFTRYLVVRLARAALTVAAVVVLVFAVVRLLPGDPVDSILGDQAAPEDRAALRAALALDRPLGAQFARFVASVADGSLGASYRKPGSTVASLIGDAAPDTAALALLSLAVALGIAIPLGVLAAVRRRTAIDDALTGLGVLGIALPHIWLGPVLIWIFSVSLGVLPLPGSDAHGPSALVLPAVTVGSGLAAILLRQTRAAMLDVLGEQYIVAARARGVGEAKLVFVHALRAALTPVLTIGAAQLGALLSGAVITERIFERRGLGTLFLEAFFTRDFPVIQGCVLVFAATYVVVQLGVDVAQAALDPRVRFGG